MTDTHFALVPDRRPAEIITHNIDIAEALSRIVEDKKWYQIINGKKHFTFEAWVHAGRFFGLTSYVESCIPIVESGRVVGYQATAQVRRHGDPDMVISRAISASYLTEPGRREHPQCMGMAQTRACSRALMIVLRDLAHMQGYSGTPAEELEDREREEPRAESLTGQNTGEASKSGASPPDIPSKAELRMMCRGAAIAVGYAGPEAGSQWLKDIYHVNLLQQLTDAQKIEIYNHAKEIVQNKPPVPGNVGA